MLRDRGVKNLGYCKYFEGEHFTFANSAAIMHVSSPLQAVKYALGAAGCSEFAFRGEPSNFLDNHRIGLM